MDFLRLFAVAVLLFGSYWSVRLAWADRLTRDQDVRSLSRSAALVPRATTYVKLADLHDSQGANPLADLLQAVALEPRNPGLYALLGLRAEVAGDLPLAEQSLLRAAELSRLYQPRYLLAQYSFRRGAVSGFDSWFRQALAVSSGSVKPLLGLWLRLHPNPGLLAELGESQRPVIAREILTCLTERGAFAEAAPLALHIASHGSADDVAPLVAYADDCLNAGSGETALKVWNRLAVARLIPENPLDEGVPGLTPLRSLPLARHAFDWRFESGEDASVVPTGDELRIILTGKQPDFRSLAWQYVPVRAGVVCRAVADVSNSRGLAAALFLRDSQGRWNELPPAAPSPGRLLRYVVFWRRQPGQARLAGALTVRKLRLECHP